MSRVLLRAMWHPRVAVRSVPRLPLPPKASLQSTSALIQLIHRCSSVALPSITRSYVPWTRSFSSSGQSVPSTPKPNAATAAPAPALAPGDSADEPAVKDSAFVSLVVRMFGNTRTERTAIRGLAPCVPLPLHQTLPSSSAPTHPHPHPLHHRYLWPKEGAQASSLRLRVAASITCLFAAKCCNVIVPLSFKEVIDTFGGNPAAVATVALPVALLAAYASSRLMAGLFSELRSALFARVAQNAVRSVSTRLFNHVQNLDLECVVFLPPVNSGSVLLTLARTGTTSAAKRARFLA